MTSVYNQLIIAWNNLDWQFRVHIAEPKEDTTIQEFLDALDSKASIWREMATSSSAAMGNMLGSAARPRYAPNPGSGKWIARSNQYPSKQNQSTAQGTATMNKLMETIISLAQGQPQPFRGRYPQRQPYNDNFYEQKQLGGRTPYTSQQIAINFS